MLVNQSAEPGVLSDWRGFLDVIAEDTERPAILSDDQVLTCGQLMVLRAEWKGALAAQGVTAGHRVATLLPDAASTAATLLALIDTVSVMPLSAEASPIRLAEQIQRAEADVILFRQETADHWHKALLSLPGMTEVTPLIWDNGAPSVRLQGNRVGAARFEREPGLVLHTSGSTGAPKRVPLAPDQLVLSAQNIARHLRLGPDDRAVHALPMFHVGAVVDLLIAPLIAGGSVIVSHGQTPDRLKRAVFDHGATWLQLVPTSLQHLIQSLTPDEAARMTDALRLVRMVSADLPEHLLRETETLLPRTTVVQMYGMTETSGQITSQSLDHTTRKIGSVGHAAGPEIALIDGEGALVAEGREGEICVRGPTVMAGYEGDDPTPRHGDWLRTGDVGRMDAEGQLTLTGRVKEMINRGGEKISPLVIERATRDLPGVVEATAFALPHPTLGEQPALAIVTDRPLTENQVSEVLQARLSPHEVPRHITFVTQLPRLPSGKTDRRALALQSRTQHEGAAEPYSPMARDVAEIWQAALKCRAPHSESDFFDDGGDSLSATEFLMQLEKVLDRRLPPNLLFEAPRFGALVDRLTEDTSASPQAKEPGFVAFVRSHIAGWRGQPAGPRGLMVARNTFQSGTPVFFCANGLILPNRIEKTVLTETPIYLSRSLHGMGEDRHKLSPALAEIYAEEVLALIAPGAPYILGGFCAGGLVMRQVADILTAKGRPPAHFIAVDVILDRPTDYPVFYLWSDNPKFSSAALYREPARGFQWLHPAGADYLHIPCPHIDLLAKPDEAAALKAALAPVLAGLPAPRHSHPEALSLDDRQTRYSARVRARVPRFLSPDRDRTMTVSVTNTSSETWPETAVSGIGLSLGYESLRHHRRYLARRTVLTLSKPLGPNETVSAKVPLRWPEASRKTPLYLGLYMVDDGIADFERDGSGSLRTLILRSPV